MRSKCLSLGLTLLLLTGAAAFAMLRVQPVHASSRRCDDVVSEALDDPQWMGRWDALVGADEGEHGGLWVATASHDTYS